MPSRPASLVLAALFFLGCSSDAPMGAGAWTGAVDTLAGGGLRVRSDTPVWAEGEAWGLVEEVRIGTAMQEGPTTFGSVAGLFMDGDGRIYVLDGHAQELRAFDRDGGHLWTAGGEGEGPGEFTRAVGVTGGPDGALWVVDARSRRYTRFDTTGAVLSESSRAVSGPFSQWAGGFTADGRLLDQGQVERAARSFGPGVALLDSALAVERSMAVPPFDAPVLGRTQGGNFSFGYPVPFAPAQVWRADPATPGLWLGTSHPYAIARVDLDGDTLVVVQRPVAELALSAADQAYVDGRLAEMVERGVTPDRSLLRDRKPVVRWLEASTDGHLWVRVWPERPTDGSVYDVFAPDGRYLGAVDTPVDLEPNLYIGADAVVGVTTDSLDVPYVVRLRIDRVGRR